MNPIYAIRLLALFGLAPLGSATVLAQEDGHAYGGLGLGAARAQLDAEAIARGQGALGIGAVDRDDRDTAYRLFGGYQFNRHLGVELGYFRLGRFGVDAVTTPPGSLAARSSVQGVGLDLVGTLPLGARWSALGRVGAQYARTHSTLVVAGGGSLMQTSASVRRTDYKLGVGLQYAFSPSFLVRGEADRYRVSDALGHKLDVDVLSLSLIFPFGRAPTAAPRAMAPVYVPPAPAAVVAQVPPPAVVAQPPPAPAPVPVPEPLRRVSFSAESLFGFDQTTPRPEAREALDAFVRQLAGTPFERINVEGHTDRLGTSAYNQALSQARADDVKAYLVTMGRVDPIKIVAAGKGESNPVTRPEDCRGEEATAALIACLQPDRRVEIDAAGTR